MDDAGKVIFCGNEQDSILREFPLQLQTLFENCLSFNREQDQDGKLLSKNELLVISYGKDVEAENKVPYRHSHPAKSVSGRKLTNRSHHWVKWIMKVDGTKNTQPFLTLKFKVLHKLGIVAIESTIDGFSGPYLLSDLILKPENVLNFIVKDDEGFECPNPHSQTILEDLSFRCFTEFVLLVGFPYRWAQDFCTLDHYNGGQFCSKSFSKTIWLIFKQFNHLIDIWENLRSTELRTMQMEIRFEFFAWRDVKTDEFRRSFTLSEDVIPMDSSRVDGRLLMAVYHYTHYELRVGAILYRRYPMSLPYLVFAVVDNSDLKKKQNFIMHDIITRYQMEVNQDRAQVNGIYEEAAQSVQILRMIFIVDEFLHPHTYGRLIASTNENQKSPSLEMKNLNELLEDQDGSPVKRRNVAVKSSSGRRQSNIFVIPKKKSQETFPSTSKKPVKPMISASSTKGKGCSNTPKKSLLLSNQTKAGDGVFTPYSSPLGGDRKFKLEASNVGEESSKKEPCIFIIPKSRKSSGSSMLASKIANEPLSKSQSSTSGNSNDFENSQLKPWLSYVKDDNAILNLNDVSNSSVSQADSESQIKPMSMLELIFSRDAYD